jgi:hypothetical protein
MRGIDSGKCLLFQSCGIAFDKGGGRVIICPVEARWTHCDRSVASQQYLYH